LVSLKAARDALLGVPAVLRSRKQIQSNLQVDPQEVMRMVSKPLRKSRNPLGLFLIIPKILITFILSVKKCREQRQLPDQADLLREISTT
jgi:hypothetical protein